MERSEGDPVSMQVNATSFEDADGKSMRFEIDSQGAQDTPPVAGIATRGADDDLRVVLTKPKRRSPSTSAARSCSRPSISNDLIEAAKHGGGAMQARVYDGSDTGAKIFATMSVIGKEATKPDEDAETAAALGGIRRWPVVVSYFDEAKTTRRPNTRFRSTSMRMAFRAASSSTMAPSLSARASQARNSADVGLRK